MNRRPKSNNTAPAQGINSKTAFRLLLAFFTARMAAAFDTFTVHQEKLPIIYANIRV